MSAELAEMWRAFADASCRGYSPLYEAVSHAVAEDDDILSLIAEAPAPGHMPTTFLAAVHYLLLGEPDQPLAARYRGETNEDVAPLLHGFCVEHRRTVLNLLTTRHTNTNEVGRSAALGPAFLTVAHHIGTPIAHVDVGCSAGLNLFCDRYRLDFGAHGGIGPTDAVVRVQCQVLGTAPPVAPILPPVAARTGIDRDP
ncbi:MAG: DUF2332 family protein, partial [Acidimicrobiales bacterium]